MRDKIITTILSAVLTGLFLGLIIFLGNLLL
jgi:predicted secreted protein